MSREGYGIYTKSPYDAVLESATKKALKGVSVNRWLVNQEQVWPATVASLQSKSRNRKADFMIKTTAKALPTSTLMRHKYGASIIDDITCPLCGGDNDTEKHLFCECPNTEKAHTNIRKARTRGSPRHENDNETSKKESEVMLGRGDTEHIGITPRRAHIRGANTHDIQNTTGRHRPNRHSNRKYAYRKGHGDACPEGMAGLGNNPVQVFRT